MASNVSADDARRIAALARLALTPEEIARFAGQLSSILAYAEAVQEVDTTGVAPMSHPMGVTGLGREDTPVPSLDRDRALAGAPDADRDAGLFRVPRVLQRDA